MKLVYIVKEHSGNAFSSKRVGEGEKMAVFGEPVNHHQDAVLALGFGEALNKIHGNHLPSYRWYMQGF